MYVTVCLLCYDAVFAFHPVTTTCSPLDMIDMEIDFHSSLCCRSTTPNSMKRARSPELGPVDRPLVCHIALLLVSPKVSL